jgi:hypothetical protein
MLFNEIKANMSILFHCCGFYANRPDPTWCNSIDGHREFYYIQMEKFARDAINDERIKCKEDIVVSIEGRVAATERQLRPS